MLIKNFTFFLYLGDYEYYLIFFCLILVVISPCTETFLKTTFKNMLDACEQKNLRISEVVISKFS